MATRKLLDAYPNTPDICQLHCDPLLNKSGICPVECAKSCPNTCLNPDESPPPSLLSHPSDSETQGPSHDKHGHTQLLLVSFLVAASVIVFILACYSVYKLCSNCCNHRRRRLRSRSLPVQEPEAGRDEFLVEDLGPNQGPAVEHHIWYIRTIGLDPAAISKITVVKFKKGEGLIEGTDCSVCLSEFEENETLRLLPKCNHAFHLPCIDTWLTAHTNCPLCRAGIVNNSAVLPAEERVVHVSGAVEEMQDEVLVGSSDGREEMEVVEGSEVVVGIEDDVNSSSQVAVRRSVSMDAFSASMLALAVNNARTTQSDDEVKESDDGVIVPKGNGINQRLLRLVGSLSIDRPACIKRSLSCNANV